MSSCIQIDNQPHSAEIDRFKSRGSTSSMSMGEELTTSSNNSGSVADNQHHLLIRSNTPQAEVSFNIIPMLGDNKGAPLNSVPKFSDEGNDFFRYIDSEPVLPPSYASINPNKRIRYPIYEALGKCSSKETPPTYSPAVEEVTVISMKTEWLSPYEPATTRNWRNFIMEINSTQLNFYRIDESLTAGIKNYSNGDSKDGNSHSHHSHFLSLSIKNAHQFNKADQERICFNVKRNRNKYLTNDKIIKSYSLQCAKLGIPTDYTKKTFVLRMRCEAEQFLLNFSHVDDMIMWTMYLQMGICVSLDLDLREYPTYRVVPRRRRRRRRRNGESLLSGTHGRSNSMGRLQLTRASSYSSTGPSTSSNDGKPSGRMKPSRSLSSGLLSLYNRSQSSKTNSEAPSKSSSAPSSRKNSVTEETVSSDFKSKLKCLFRSKSNSRAGASSRKVTVEKFKRQSRELNCVMEDEEEDTGANVIRTMSLPVKEQSRMISKVVTLPAELNESCISKKTFSESTVPINTSNHLTTAPDAIPLPVTREEECPLSNVASVDIAFPTESRNNAHVQRELEEFREVVREHNEAADETVCDATDEVRLMRNCSADDDEEEEDDDEDEDSHTVNDSFDQSRSVYIDEGIFHDSDDDYVYTMERRNNYRNRASSSTSALSNTPYGSDEVKWSPPTKRMSRRRYIRDSLRCIKPLSEGHRWIGKVVFRPAKAPDFETNNLPITIGNYSHSISSIQRKTVNKNSWKDVDYKQTKNHSLKIFTVGPFGYLKAGTKVFDALNDI